MKAKKVLGIFIIIVLILSVALVGYNAFMTNVNNENVNNVILTQDQLMNMTNETTSENESNNTTIINLNIDQSEGGTEIIFVENSDDICNITYSGSSDSTKVTYEKDDQTLNINVNSNNTENKIVLSTKYYYNINGKIVSGGLKYNLTEQAKIINSSVDISAGGLSVYYNGGSITNLNTNITLGGISIVGQPIGTTFVTNYIAVGGVNIETSSDVNVHSTVKLGGVNAPGLQQSEKDGITYIKSDNFNDVPDRFSINNNIEIGGLNIVSP